LRYNKSTLPNFSKRSFISLFHFIILSCSEEATHQTFHPPPTADEQIALPQPAKPVLEVNSDNSYPPHSPIKADEEIIFFPTMAQLKGSFWQIPIHGWIYEPEPNDSLRNLMIGQLNDLLDINEQELQSQIFADRLHAFMVDNERNKQITIRIGEENFMLPESAENGHFYGTLQIKPEQAAQLAPTGVLHFTAITRPEDRRNFTGQSFLLSHQGLMIISDIDDTVKISQVRDKKALLRNTFLQPFQPVPGMAQVYQNWVTQQTAHLHFVSSSPWQLFPVINQMLNQARFPAATFDLKNFRPKDTSILNLFTDPETTKAATIEPILQAFPERKFILVGDSGEKDPEVYAALGKKYPTQIEKIFIRDVTGDNFGGPRYRAAFAGFPRERWQIFTNPSELP